jgi:thiol-disulfide isomerase/thioredoxin
MKTQVKEKKLKFERIVKELYKKNWALIMMVISINMLSQTNSISYNDSIIKKRLPDYYYNLRQEKLQRNIGHQFPTFQVESLFGQVYTEKNLIGKVTFVNFWFEYCSPCIAEFPELNDLFIRLNDNKKFQLLSFTKDSYEQAKASVLKYQLLFPVICISEKECFSLNFHSGFPTNIIVDETGKIIFIKSGGSLNKQQIEANFQKLSIIIEQALSK